MTRKSMMKAVLAIFALMLIFNVGTYAQKTDCSNMTDDEIISVIYKQIEAKYPQQMDHINIRIDDGVLTLEGWVTTKKVSKTIYKYAKKYTSKKKYDKNGKCVKEIVNNLTIGVGGGCGPGQIPCGSTCIPGNAACNIGKGKEH